ncbi:MAG: excinuclease ABC subunit A [Gammaproteobacteria bacterium]
MPEAKSQLDSTIRYYFGDQEHPAVAKNFGEYATNKKTNALNKEDEEACRWVFLSAMLELQERAHKLGADGVINIRSNYRNNEFSSKTRYECGAGFLMAGVALKADFVKFADK